MRDSTLASMKSAKPDRIQLRTSACRKGLFHENNAQVYTVLQIGR